MDRQPEMAARRQGDDHGTVFSVDRTGGSRLLSSKNFTSFQSSFFQAVPNGGTQRGFSCEEYRSVASNMLLQLVLDAGIFPRQAPVTMDTRGNYQQKMRESACLAGGCKYAKSPEQKHPGLKNMVPRDRIELPTRGFSVPCSTN